MALTYRMHDLGLLTAWQYRSTCADLSARGYRSDEPQGLEKRETSQILTKVFQGLWSKGIRPGDVADPPGVTAEEMGRCCSARLRRRRKTVETLRPGGLSLARWGGRVRLCPDAGPPRSDRDGPWGVSGGAQSSWATLGLSPVAEASAGGRAVE
ncbi:hypothetical protein ABZ464_38325 [Streptomyces sp. NPDC005820]|uniref:hypothetical protein n=1 Tax=Streptomyces sp. NPDC005820 TaxID=3157069 RepID=UPI0033F7262C